MNVKINDDTFSGDCYFEESESFYYNSTCSYTISRYQILQGNNELTIVLYPNISGTHSAKRYKQEVHFKIERPIISIKSCTGLTSDGILTCLYQRLDQSDVTTVIESNVDLLYQNQTHIELQMYHGMREIKIWAQNVFGIRSKIEKMYIPSSDEVKRMPTSSEKENDGKSNNILIIICCIVIVIHVVLLFQTKGRKVWRKIRNCKVWTRTVGQGK
ncbi:uncharacterized protein LOC131954688 [Physella acuta]|uniref:uncharacterized protein LOC131954688 n=1 Tax=Physella acuta TaxID=109671 RepID=UPI0027DBB8D2|nr:uncharacterized protein LOC131954688 [Physella acuta]